MKSTNTMPSLKVMIVLGVALAITGMLLGTYVL